jgi:hypothetical protein
MFGLIHNGNNGELIMVSKNVPCYKKVMLIFPGHYIFGYENNNVKKISLDEHVLHACNREVPGYSLKFLYNKLYYII